MSSLSLAKFKYLQWRRIVTFMIVLALSSMLSSTTALTLTSFYDGLSEYIGESENVVVIYNAKSRTPFTGLIPAFLTERIVAVDGVSACSPEVVVPCIVNGESIFLRGVLLEEFMKLSSLTVIDGEMLSSRDLNYVIIGRRASEILDLKVGDKVLVIGVLSPICLELRVKGVFTSSTLLDDEVIAPLHVGQWLRGAGYDYVTIVRVKVEGGREVREAVFNAIAKIDLKANESKLEFNESREEGQPREGSLEQPIARWATVRFRIEDVGVKEAEKFMEDYMERYGVTKESILVLSIATLIFSGATIMFATRSLVSQHGDEIEVLRSIGVSKRLLRRDLVLKLIPASILASVLGIAISTIILSVALESGVLQVLFHSTRLRIDTLMTALISTAILLIVAVGVWRSTR